MPPVQHLADRPFSRWAVFSGLSLSLFLSIANGTSLNVALPALRQDFAASFAQVQWLLLAFIASTIVFMPLVGALGDALDKRKLFTAGVLVFGLGSVACAVAPTLLWLVLGRALQGVGTAVISALAFAILAEVFPAEERGMAIGWSSGLSTLAIVCGPALGGVVVSALSWRWLFWLVAPPALALALFCWRVLPGRSEGGARPLRLDVAGLLASSGALLGLLLGLTLLPERGLDLPVVTLFAAAALCLVVLKRRLETASQPLADLEVLRRPPIFVALAGEMALFAATHSFFFLLPFVLENGLRLTPLQIGLVLVTNPAIQAAVSPLSGHLSDRWGEAPLTVAGLFFLGLGFWTMAGLDLGDGPLQIALRLVPFGLGVGLFVPANAAAVVRAAPPERMASTTAALALARRVAQASGVAVLTLVWTRQLGGAANAAVAPSPAELMQGFSAVLWLLQGFVAAGLVIQLLRPPARLAAAGPNLPASGNS